MTIQRHEIPTHLNVEDRAFYGLSIRQVMYLTAGSTLAYALWNQWSDVPVDLRLALALASAVVGVALALVRPFGRGVEEWAVVLLCYWLTPRRSFWLPSDPTTRHAEDGAAGWIELAPSPRWKGDPTCDG